MGQSSWLVLWYWGIGQATFIGAMTFCLIWLCRRIAPALRARLALWALWLMCAAPAAMLLPLNASPISAWILPKPTAPAARPLPAGEAPILGDESRLAAQGIEPWNAWLADATTWLATSVDGIPPSGAESQRAIGWGEAVAWLMVGCICWGWLRLLVGQWQVRALRREARPCTDTRLLRLIHECSGTLNVATAVEWLQHATIGTPAVIGLREPAIVLPDECEGWSDEQLRCALLHELAHVQRNDVRSTLAAQIALAINYFHPLGHLLVRCMRMDQELAADCLAAPVVGGQQRYLETLAALALRSADATVGPALAFLPARRTFVRRLEMLRTLRIASSRGSFWQASTLSAALGCIAIVATLIRPTIAQQTVASPQQAGATVGGPQSTLAAPGSTNVANVEKLPELISYLPDAVVAGAILIDVENAFQSPAMAQILSQMPAEQRTFHLPNLKLPIEDVHSIMVIVPASLNPNEMTVAIRFKASKQLPKASDTSGASTKSYGLAPAPGVLDERTLLFGNKTDEFVPLLRLSVATSSGGDLRPLLRRHPDSCVTAVLRTSAVAQLVKQPRPELSMLAPLWQDVTTVSLGVQMRDSLKFSAVLDTSRPKVVYETLLAVRTLARNSLDSLAGNAQPLTTRTPQEAMMLSMVRTIGSKALDDLTVTEEAAAVKVEDQIDQAAPMLVGLLLPAMQASREAARRAQAMNSLKQIGLAMHNYHETYGHLPPAIIEEKGVQRSWRVELLPFVEQADLYDKYRKDEPWNSPANLKILQTPVPVYAAWTASGSPPADPTLTSVRGIGGPRGVLGLTARSFRDITDGTSNTIFAVHVKDMVPWTQPDEYAPTPEELIKAAPSNVFLAGLVDGSVHAIAVNVDLKLLEALMTINGGERATGF